MKIGDLVKIITSNEVAIVVSPPYEYSPSTHAWIFDVYVLKSACYRRTNMRNIEVINANR